MDSAHRPATRQERKPDDRQPTLDFGANGPASFEAKVKPNRVEPASLSTTEFPATRSSLPGPNRPQSAETVPLWLMRVWVVIRVAFFVELGMVLVVLPWTRSWIENGLLVSFPAIQIFLQNNFIRGAISGLGFLDIGFGIWEAVRYKEPPRHRPS